MKVKDISLYFWPDRYFEFLNFIFQFSDIPHFKEVVIMATVCEYCGHKTNEVKSGGGIESKGKRIILNVTDPSDMSRDVLKVLIFDQLCKIGFEP